MILRVVRLVVSCVVLGVGVAMLLLAALGSDGYSTMVNGLSLALDLDFWIVNLAIGAGLVALAWARGLRVALMLSRCPVLAAGVAGYLAVDAGAGPTEAAALSFDPRCRCGAATAWSRVAARWFGSAVRLSARAPRWSSWAWDRWWPSSRPGTPCCGWAGAPRPGSAGEQVLHLPDLRRLGVLDLPGEGHRLGGLAARHLASGHAQRTLVVLDHAL